MTNITFSQVQKSFHKKLVLDIPDFQADSGEIFSIVGGNGAGKSTFIKLLAGIFLQDKGEVRVYGVSNRSKKIHSLVKFVLESGQGLYSYLTAMENLQYFLSLNGIALSHIKAEVDVLCDQLAFTPYKDTLVSELSQGNRQKLTLILALVQKPKVLCLDEPTNGLDLLAKKQLMTLLQDYARHHQASIFITSHDASFIEKVSTRVVVIQEGRLYREGTFEEIFGNSEHIAILVEAEDVFHPEVLEAIKTLGAELLERVPYAKSLMSITDIDVTIGTDEGLEIIHPFSDGIPQKTEKIETTIVEIPFNTVTKNLSKDSTDTSSKVIQEGKNGKKEITSRNTYIGDSLVDSIEISSKVLEEPLDKIIQVSAKSVSRSGSGVSRWNYTDAEIDLLCAITAQECSTSYEGALAVITTAMNRAASPKWRQYGRDPLSQYKGKNQFTYSIDGLYKKRLNGRYKSFVKQAVLDALNGKRNHNYLSFNAVSTGRSGKIIGDNVYF